MNKAFISILVLIFCFGCYKDEPMPTNLIITTVDENGNTIQGASVELYPSILDWLQETSQIYDTMESDIDGNVTFIEIDTGSYYINAYKGIANNWEEGVKKTVIEGFQNTTNITVVENSSGNLSRATGKKWVLKTYIKNGADFYDFIDECEKDDTLTFYKGSGTGVFNISHGTSKCSQSEEDDISGIWTLLNNGNALRIQLGNDIVNWNIDTLKVENLNVTYVESGNILNVVYSPIEQ